MKHSSITLIIFTEPWHIALGKLFCNIKLSCTARVKSKREQFMLYPAVVIVKGCKYVTLLKLNK